MTEQLVVSFLGYLVGAFCLALWWGERGKRIDARAREGALPAGASTPKIADRDTDPAGLEDADDRNLLTAG